MFTSMYKSRSLRFPETCRAYKNCVENKNVTQLDQVKSGCRTTLAGLCAGSVTGQI